MSVAVVNRTDLCVVAGPTKAVRSLRHEFEQRGIESRLLNTSHAFHSQMMEPILAPFGEAVSRVALQPPQIPIVSTAQADWLTPELATSPQYWVQHLRQAVRFADSIAHVLGDPSWLLLEVGPGQTLGALAQQHPQYDRQQRVLSSLPSAAQAGPSAAQAGPSAAQAGPSAAQAVPASESIHRTLGQLWLVGTPVKWAAYWAGETRQRQHLPGYAFEGKRYWIEAAATGPAVAHGAALQPAPPQPSPENPVAAAMSPTSRANGATPVYVVERLVTEQLQVMSQQINLWRQPTSVNSTDDTAD